MTFFESPKQWFSALSDTTLSFKKKKKLLLEVKSMDNIAYLPHKKINTMSTVMQMRNRR